MPTDKRELLLVIKGRDQGAKSTLKGVGDAADDAKDDLQDMQSGLRKLDGQIVTSTKKVEGLRKEINRSGDLGLIKDLEKADRELRKLTKQRKLLGPGDGEDGAKGFFAGFSARIGPLMARAPISPPLIGAVAAASPAIASLVSAAVGTGVAVAPIAAGLVIAARNPAVAAAGAQLGKDLLGDLEDSATPFVSSTIKSIGIVKAEFKTIKPVVDDIFADAADDLPRLTQAAAAGAVSFTRSFRAAQQNAAPYVDVLAEHIPKAAEAAGDAIEILTGNAENNAKTLDATFEVLEFSMVHAANATNLLGKAFDYSAGGAIKGWIADADSAKETTADLAEEQRALADGINAAAAASNKMVESLRDLNDVQLSANDAERGFQAAVDDAKEAFDGKVKSLNLGTEKGRAYSSALDGIASSARDSAQAIYENTGSQEDANRKINEGRDALYKQARAFGLSKADAQRYVNQVLAIPKRWTTTVSAETAAAEANLRETYEWLQRLRSRKLTVTVVQRMIRDNDYTGLARGYEEGGYINGLPGPKGKDSGWIRAAKGEYMLDAQDVDRLGGPRAIDSWRRNLERGLASYRTPVAGGGGATSGMAAASGSRTAGGPGFGWVGMDRSFISFMISAISAAGGDPSVLRIGRGRAG